MKHPNKYQLDESMNNKITQKVAGKRTSDAGYEGESRSLQGTAGSH